MAVYRMCGDDLRKIQHIFAGRTDTLILSCLQGYMGSAWADSPKSPQSAQILLGDFCFFCRSAE